MAGFVIIDKYNDIYRLELNDTTTPTDISLSSNGIIENSPIGTTIGSFSTTDTGGGLFTYSLVSGSGDTDNASFSIVGSNLLSNTEVDFETKSDYTVRIRSTNSSNNYFEKQFQILVADQNEYPILIILNNQTISEDSLTNTLVGSFTCTDPDIGDTLTYILVSGSGSSGNSSFSIVNGNELRNITTLNYETTPSLSIRVRATDTGGLYVEQQFTITVTNVNEAPTAINLSNINVTENTPIGTVVATITSTDPDLESLTYSLVSGSGSSGNSYFTIVGDELRINTLINYELTKLLYIRIRATDVGGLWIEAPFTIIVANQNEAPTVITLSTNTIAENSSIGTLAATIYSSDPDAGDSATYALVSGTGATHNSYFTISGNSLLVNAGINYESITQLSIRIRCTDNGLLSFEGQFVLNVVNVNESPTNINLTGSSVQEGSSIGTLVGLFDCVDPDTIDSVIFTLLPGYNSNKFSISGNQLLVAGSIDYELNQTLSINVRAQDSGGLYFDKVFTITVINILDTITDILLSKYSIPDSYSSNMEVATMYSISEAGSVIFTYTLVAGGGSADNSKFSITGDKLTILDDPDFNIQSEYSIRIKSTDDLNNTFEKPFTLSVEKIYGGYIAIQNIKYNRNDIIEIDTDQAVIDYNSVVVSIGTKKVEYVVDELNRKINATIPDNYVNLGRSVNGSYVLSVLSGGYTYSTDVRIGGDNIKPTNQISGGTKGSTYVKVPALKPYNKQGAAGVRKVFIPDV